MSVVRKGYDPILERHTALKVLSAAPGERRKRERFLDEARITGQLEHPNVVPVYEFGTNPQGHDYINMKLVQGETFLQRIKGGGTPPTPSTRAAMSTAWGASCTPCSLCGPATRVEDPSTA